MKYDNYDWRGDDEQQRRNETYKDGIRRWLDFLSKAQNSQDQLGLLSSAPTEPNSFDELDVIEEAELLIQ